MPVSTADLLQLASDMFPLRTLSGVVALLVAIVKYPLGMPHRAERASEALADLEVGQVFTVPGTRALLARMGASI